MKKIFCLLLVFALLFTLFGCSKEQDKFIEPVSFYYRRAELTYAQENSVIATQLREGADFEDLPMLLQTYLKGPASDEFAQTFPEGTQLISILFNGPVAEVVISNHINNLSELERNIACSCICMTVLALTDAQSVRIRVEAGLTQQSFLFDMRNNDIILKDQAEMP